MRLDLPVGITGIENCKFEIMSWQPYIDDHLLAELPHGGQLEHAAIAGHSGDIWAQSPNFPELSLEEATAIVDGFDDQASLAQKGLHIGGVKYIVIAGEAGAVIRGQKGRDGKHIPAARCLLVSIRIRSAVIV